MAALRGEGRSTDVESADASLDGSLDPYQAAVAALEVKASSHEALLGALLQRDRISAGLKDAKPTPAWVLRLAGLDERLRLASERLRDVNWDALRGVHAASVSPWWWRLDEVQAARAEERDYLRVLAAGLLMTATLGLGADISVRLWGSGAGGLSVVSLLLTVVFTGGPLTSQGRELARWLIARLRLPQRRRGASMLVAATVFFLMALGLRVLALPTLATVYNNRGFGLLQGGDLAGAQRSFERAVSIDPEYAAAYYNLGSAYVEVGNYDQALLLLGQALAADRSLDLAYAEMGYVLIQQHEPERAIPILYNGLAVAQDDAGRVALLTNLGRAYLEAGRPWEAESALVQALAVSSTEAAAHCTLALVAEELARDPEQTRLNWENCLSYADPTTPRGQERADMARAHLRLLEEAP